MVDAAISLIPYAGAPLQILFDDVMEPNLLKRREDWARRLGEAVREVQERLGDFDPKAMFANDAFVSGVIQASRIAVSSHREEKLDMLRAALVNLGLGLQDSDLMSSRCLRFVDELEVEHFVVLRFASDPEAWFKALGEGKPNIYMGSRKSVMAQAHLPVGGEVLDLVLEDLGKASLIGGSGSLGTMMSEHGLYQPFITGLGQKLLVFVGQA